MGELVHVVELDDIVGYKEEFCGALTHRLVHLASRHQQLHGRVDFYECLACLLRHLPTLHELLDEELSLDKQLLRLVFL